MAAGHVHGKGLGAEEQTATKTRGNTLYGSILKFGEARGEVPAKRGPRKIPS